MSIKTMLVDDEPFVLKDMRNMLRQVNSIFEEEIEIICESRTIDEAKKNLLENNLDLVFLDIQLRGGTGFDLIPYIDEAVKIIFVTAYDQYAVRAFEVNALDYILKPVKADRLSQSLVRLFKSSPSRSKIDKQLLFKTNDRVLVKTDTNQLFIKIDEVAAIYSIGGNYATILLKSGEKHLSRKTIKAWDAQLPDSVFVRIHRATIINIHFTKEVAMKKDGTCTVYQTGHKETFTVSRRMGKKFKAMIKHNEQFHAADSSSCNL